AHCQSEIFHPTPPEKELNGCPNPKPTFFLRRANENEKIAIEDETILYGEVMQSLQYNLCQKLNQVLDITPHLFVFQNLLFFLAVRPKQACLDVAVNRPKAPAPLLMRLREEGRGG